MADGGTPPRVSALRSLQRAWGRLIDNAGVLLTLSLVLYLFDAPWTLIRVAWVPEPYSMQWWTWFATGAAVSFLVVTPFRFGFLWATLEIARGIPAHFDHFARGWRNYFRVLAGSALYTLLVLLGLLLLVVPGLILAARCSMFPYRIMAGHAGPIKALRQSWELTAGHTGAIMGHGALVVATAALGSVTFGLVPLVVFPFLFVAYGDMYHGIAEPESSAAHAHVSFERQSERDRDRVTA